MTVMKSSLAVGVLSMTAIVAIGIPFLDHDPELESLATTEDAQDIDTLWREIQFLQDRAERFGSEEFQDKFLDATALYLKFDEPSRSRFHEVVDEALEHLRSARTALDKVHQKATHNPEEAIPARRKAWSQWQAEQRAASDRLLVAMDESARHDLLAEKRLHWLLRLDHTVESLAPR